MRGLGGRLALLAISIVAALVVLELGCRLARGRYYVLHWPNLVLDLRQGVERYFNTVMHPDAELGFVPRRGYAGGNLSHDENGLRRTPVEPGIADRPLLLAMGDSFTYGAEVADGDTWPSRLQNALHLRVANGGVAAYGLDQIVMRTERLARQLRPQAIVVSFIPDDLRRAELSRFLGFEKPYLVQAGDSLVVHNVPVPAPPPAGQSLTFWQRALGWSVLLDMVLQRLGGPEDWPYDSRRVLSDGAGEKMACPLMKRLAVLSIPTLVVAQYDPSAWDGDAGIRAEQRQQAASVLRCAGQAGLATLDTYDALTAAGGGQGPLRFFRPEGHLDAEGNAIVARTIAAALKRLGLPAQ